MVGGGLHCLPGWGIVLMFAALGLAVPLAILLGAFRPAGPVLVSGSASLIASAVFWVVKGGILGLPAETNVLAGVAILMGSVVLLIMTWTLALNAAAQSRLVVVRIACPDWSALYRDAGRRHYQA